MRRELTDKTQEQQRTSRFEKVVEELTNALLGTTGMTGIGYSIYEAMEGRYESALIAGAVSTCATVSGVYGERDRLYNAMYSPTGKKD